MTQIRDCMTQDCQIISPETTLCDAASLMAAHDLGFLPVAENDKMIGTLTDRDIVIRALATGQDPMRTQARDVMTSRTFYCYDDELAEDVCANMADLQIRRMPVVDRNKQLVGMVSMGDLAQRGDVTAIGEAEQRITAQTQNGRAA